MRDKEYINKSFQKLIDDLKRANIRPRDTRYCETEMKNAIQARAEFFLTIGREFILPFDVDDLAALYDKIFFAFTETHLQRRSSLAYSEQISKLIFYLEGQLARFLHGKKFDAQADCEFFSVYLKLMNDARVSTSGARTVAEHIGEAYSFVERVYFKYI